ncbi:MAG: VOC family protein [Stigonema ocellatum SAG 48.90 = DSM 106950]|nr:VOC family protein [Stigonema ocellatum SAG 48.90 = DSM 106950]
MSHPPIDQQITFLYTKDLATSAQFYEDKLGKRVVALTKEAAGFTASVVLGT